MFFLEVTSAFSSDFRKLHAYRAVSGHNMSLEAFSSNSTEASHGNTKSGDNQSVTSDDPASNQPYRSEYNAPQEVRLYKLTPAVRNIKIG